MNLIQQMPIGLEETQRQTLLEILDNEYKQGLIQTPEEYQAELARLLSNLEAKMPMMQVREQHDRTDPESFTRTLQELTIDIATVFQQLKQIDQTAIRHQQLSQGIINDVKLRLKKISDELDCDEILADNNDSKNVVLEVFRDSSSFESNPRLYTDSGNNLVAPGYHAKLDVFKEAIQLPTMQSENVLIGPGGARWGKIRISKQLGSGYIRLANPEHETDKAIDTSYETYWQETILSDSPIEVPLGSDYFNVQYGAFCELEILFDAVTQFNEIRLVPFAQYPLDVVGIRGFDTDYDTFGFDIVTPTGEGTVYAKSSTEPMVFQFADQVAKRVKILLNQRHYIRNDYILNGDIAETMALWFAGREIDTKALIANAPIYQNQIENNPAWSMFSKATKRAWDFFSKNLHSLSTEKFEAFFRAKSKVIKPVTKYAYNYGLYNIEIFRNEYQDHAVYVSKPANIPGTIKAISIEVDEEHPDLFDFTSTNIEYYLSDNNGQSWLPVFPRNYNKIAGELLEVKPYGNAYNAVPKFPVQSIDTLRCNGITLTLGEDYTFAYGIITFLNYLPGTAYTIDYVPKEGQEVDLLQQYMVDGEIVPLQSTEQFLGTDSNGSIKLKHYPFVDKTKLNAQLDDWDPTYLENDYVPIVVEITVSDGKHIRQHYNAASTTTPHIVNRTDYFSSQPVVLSPFDEEAGNYQYLISGNILKLNAVLDKKTKITVKYPHLSNSIRIKAILRRTMKNPSGTTPLLNKYIVHYKILS